MAGRAYIFHLQPESYLFGQPVKAFRHESDNFEVAHVIHQLISPQPEVLLEELLVYRVALYAKIGNQMKN